MRLFHSIALVLALLGPAVFAGDLTLVVTTPVETTLDRKRAADTAETWVEMFKEAKGPGDTIDLEQFYLTNEKGEPLEKVLTVLRAAAKKGVEIRLLVDKTFLKNTGNGGTEELKDTKNIEIRTIDYTKLGGGVQHAKFFIVNGKEAFLGSANFDWRALKHIHETGVRTTDAHVVTSLQTIFEKDWKRGVLAGSFKFKDSVKAAPKIAAAKDIAFAASPEGDLPKGMTSTLAALKKLVASAKTSVQLQTMDYNNAVFGKKGESWKEFQNVLLKAAKKAKVQLLVDYTKANAPGIKELIKGGVEVKSIQFPDAKSGHIDFARLIHSKYVLVDGERFWLGTDNYAKNYFQASRGVGVVASDKTAATQLSETFEELWDSSYAHKL